VNVAEEGPGLKSSGRGESASTSKIFTSFTTFPLGTREVQRREEIAVIDSLAQQPGEQA
jgi:hypothetical protein